MPQAHSWAIRRPAHVCLIDEVVAIIDPGLGGLPAPDATAEVDALVIDGDPSSKNYGTDSRVHHNRKDLMRTESTPPAASQRVLQHLADALWRLNNDTHDLADLAKALLAEMPTCFEEERRIELSFYCQMPMAPVEHRLKDGHEHMYYVRLVAGCVEEECALHRLAVPAGVRVAFADGSTVEQDITFCRALDSPLAILDATDDLIGVVHRMQVPLCSASSQRILGVIQISCMDGNPIRAEERFVITRLASAFGASAARIYEQNIADRQRQQVTLDAQYLRTQIKQLEFLK